MASSNNFQINLKVSNSKELQTLETQLSNITKLQKTINRTKVKATASTISGSGSATSVSGSFNTTNIVKLNSEVNKTTEGVKKLTTSAGKAGGAISILGGVFAAVGTAAALTAGKMYLMSEAVSALTSTASEFEQVGAILNTLEGSSAKAEQSFRWIEEFAKTSPLSLQEVSNAFVKMRAYGIDPTNGSLTTLTDTALAMGKDLGQAVEAVADAVVGENERLKEFGVKASLQGDQILYSWTDASGKSKAKLVENNKEIIESTLYAIFNEKYAGQAEKFMDTYRGINSVLEDNVAKMKNTIATQSGIFDGQKELLKGINSELEAFMASESFGTVISEISGSYTSLVSGVEDIVVFILETANVIDNSMVTIKNSINSILESDTLDSVSDFFSDYYTGIYENGKKIKNSLVDLFSFGDEFGNIKIDKDSLNLDGSESFQEISKQLIMMRSMVSSLEDVAELGSKIPGLKLGIELDEEKASNNEFYTNAINKVRELSKSIQKEVNNTLSSSNIKTTDIGEHIVENITRDLESISGGFSMQSQIQEIEKINKSVTAKEILAQEKRKKALIDYYKDLGDDTLSFEQDLIQKKAEYIKSGITDTELDALEIQLRKDYNNRKLTEELNSLSAYYEAVEDYTKQGELRVKALAVQLSEDKNLSEAQKQEILNIEAKNQAYASTIKILDQEIERAQILEDVQTEAVLRSIRLQEELNEKKIEQSEIDRIVAEDARKFALENSKALSEQLSIAEAFSTTMNTSLAEMGSKIMTAGEMTAEATKNSFSEMETHMVDFFNASSDSFGDFEDLAKNVLQSVLESIAEVVAQQLAAQASMALLSSFGGSSGGFGSLFGFAKGGAFSGGSQISAYANGGAFSGGVEVHPFAKGGEFTNSVINTPTMAPMSLFGEAGPEAIMPLKRTSSGELGVIASGGKGGVMSITINNNVPGTTLRQTTDENGNKILTLDEIDAGLAQKQRLGSSNFGTMLQKR